MVAMILVVSLESVRVENVWISLDLAFNSVITAHNIIVILSLNVWIFTVATINRGVGCAGTSATVCIRQTAD